MVEIRQKHVPVLSGRQASQESLKSVSTTVEWAPARSLCLLLKMGVQVRGIHGVQKEQNLIFKYFKVLKFWKVQGYQNFF